MSEKNPSVVRLGQVRATRDHDYLQFFIALLTALAVVCGLAWMWYATDYYRQAYAAIGPYFMVGFAALLALGVFKGLQQSWWISRSINRVKRCQNLEGLQEFFGFEPNSKVSAEYLKDVIDKDLHLRYDGINYLANVSAGIGFFGTLLGIMLLVGEMKGIHAPEDVFKHMSPMADGLALAFGTSIVGFIVSVINKQMSRIVYRATVVLDARIMRVLHHSG